MNCYYKYIRHFIRGVQSVLTTLNDGGGNDVLKGDMDGGRMFRDLRDIKITPGQTSHNPDP